jgi:hypothetical protein
MDDRPADTDDDTGAAVVVAAAAVKSREGLCEACTGRDGAPCRYRATREHEGERLCGVHHRQRATSVECPICLCPITRGRARAEMRCGHAFHSKCIRAWFRQRPLTCPMCRAACLEGMAMLGPRVSPKLQALLRTVPPPPRAFFPSYIVHHLQTPQVVASLGGDAGLVSLLMDIACECFTRANFFAKVRGMGL